MRLERTRSRLGALGVLAATVTIWVLLAPVQLGGSTSFATIVGVSMEPHLHRGDLVLVRKRSDYRVGDAVAYRSAALHRIVLHRIVAIQGGRYVFKGDNNSFTDPGTASRRDLIGKQWIRIAGGGEVFGWLHKPWVTSLLAIGAVLLLFGTGAATARRRGSRGRRAAVSAWSPPAELASLLGPVTVAAGAAAAVYLVLAGIAFGLPTERSVPTQNLYGSTGSFAYSAVAPPSATYPRGRVVSGDTVFTRIVQVVDFRFSWRLETQRPHAIGGTAALAALISDGGGWSRRITLALPSAFRGDHATVRGRLDLGAVRRMIARFERETGTHLDQYRIAIDPRISFRGRIDGKPVSDSFSPSLALTLGRQALQLGSLGSATTTPGLVRSDTVPGMTTAPNRLSLGPVGLRVASARVVGLVGALLSLLLLGAAALASARMTSGDPVERELAQSGQQVVRIEYERSAERRVDVRTLSGLLEIARRYDRVLLLAERTGAYLVEDDGVVYRWNGPAPPGPPPPLVERRDLSRRPWAARPEEKPLGRTGVA